MIAYQRLRCILHEAKRLYWLELNNSQCLKHNMRIYYIVGEDRVHFRRWLGSSEPINAEHWNGTADNDRISIDYFSEGDKEPTDYEDYDKLRKEYNKLNEELSDSDVKAKRQDWITKRLTKLEDKMDTYISDLWLEQYYETGRADEFFERVNNYISEVVKES